MSLAEAKQQQIHFVWLVLKLTYGIVPIVAGLDKFTNLLVQWDQYLSPFVAKLLPMSVGAFFGIIGIIEIVAGVLVLRFPKAGGYVVSAWLVLIALVLLGGQRYDIAVRDLVMAVGAFALAQLTDIKSN